MKDDLFYLRDKYSDEEITSQINKVIIGKSGYKFYILYHDDGLGNCKPSKYYELTIQNLEQIKKEQLIGARAPIVIRKRIAELVNFIVLPRYDVTPELSVQVTYNDLLGGFFDKNLFFEPVSTEETLQNPKIKEKLKNKVSIHKQRNQELEWITEAIKIANNIAAKKWKLGIQEITARNICEAVASELAKNSKYWGRKGPRTGTNIRKVALKGWRFIPS